MPGGKGGGRRVVVALSHSATGSVPTRSMGTIQISRHLHLLQDHAGAALFEKDGTGLRLTPAGTAFHASVRTALDELESAYRRLVSDAQAPGLHVACSVTFAMRWLVPQLAVFYHQHPEIRIRLSMTSAREMRNEGADLILAWDLSGYTEADQRQAIVRFGAVCTPDYARKQPADRVRIGHEYTTSAWNQWEAITGEQAAQGEALAFPHTHLCIEAALSGLGMALVEQRLISRELQEGRLVAPYGFTPFAGGLRAVPAVGRIRTAQADAFIAWLRGTLAEPAASS